MNTHHTPTYYRVRSLVRFAFVAGVAVIAFSVGRAIANDPYQYRCDGSAVIVNAGDTLWSLAQKHCEGHTGHAVHDLAKVHGDQVRVGEIISFATERK